MKRRFYLPAIAILLLGLATPLAVTLAQETVYGYELMTPQERQEHQQKMRSFRTEQEREAYRQEHHKLMQERAREQGKKLPDTPMPRGQGMGGGRGPGGQR
jgi:uncharacterized membrane protein (DUF106 family)